MLDLVSIEYSDDYAIFYNEFPSYNNILNPANIFTKSGFVILILNVIYEYA